MIHLTLYGRDLRVLDCPLKRKYIQEADTDMRCHANGEIRMTA